MGTPVNFPSHLAWPLGVALAILLAVLVAFLFVRRGYRHQYFRRLDEAREECEPVLEGVFSGSARYEEGLASLRALSGRRPSGYLETLLLADKNPPGGTNGNPRKAMRGPRPCRQVAAEAVKRKGEMRSES